MYHTFSVYLVGFLQLVNGENEIIVNWVVGLYLFVFQILKEASRLYAASWVRDIGPDLRPNDYKKKVEGSEDGSNGGKNTTTQEKEPSALEDLGKKPCLTICVCCCQLMLSFM